MAGRTPDQASYNSLLKTIAGLGGEHDAAVGWNGIGASLADSRFAPVFSDTFNKLNGDSFIAAVTTEVFGQPMVSDALRDALAIYIDYYSHYPVASDVNGTVRAKGYFIADMLHQASDFSAAHPTVAVGKYELAAETFLVGLADGSKHYGDILF